MLGARLIRLQCYEGIDVAHALYDWSYARQMLYIRTLEAAGDAGDTDALHEVFGPRVPACAGRCSTRSSNDDDVPPVLLIDEIDRADDEFEAFLLELLSDFQVTIPEIGTIRRKQRPVVILTSNRTRELHDALQAPLPLPLDRRTRRSSARSRSCARACPACPSGSPPRPPRFVRALREHATWPSRPAWPRRSTGRRRWSRSASEELDARRRRRDARLGAQVPRGHRARARRTACSSCVAEAREAAGPSGDQ